MAAQRAISLTFVETGVALLLDNSPDSSRHALFLAIPTRNMRLGLDCDVRVGNGRREQLA